MKTPINSTGTEFRGIVPRLCHAFLASISSWKDVLKFPRVLCRWFYTQVQSRLFWMSLAVTIPILVSVAGAVKTADQGAPWFTSYTELSSIFTTLVVTVVFWFLYFTGDRAIFGGSKPSYTAFAALLLILFCLLFAGAGYLAWHHYPVWGQVLALVAGAICMVTLELIALKALHQVLGNLVKQVRADEAKSEGVSGAAESSSTAIDAARSVLVKRDNMYKYLCYSDVPLAVALGLLAALVVYLDLVESRPDQDPTVRSFVAGAVALQLLYSNSVFWLEAFAEHPLGERWFKRRSKWLSPVLGMLNPAGSARNSQWVRNELTALFDEPAESKAPTR